MGSPPLIFHNAPRACRCTRGISGAAWEYWRFIHEDPAVTETHASADRVFGLAYNELRRLAHAVRQNRPDATLSTTELLHEAWFKLQPASQLGANDSQHLKRVVARAMRQVLIDGARRHAVRVRHAEAQHEPVTADQRHSDEIAAALLDLDQALEALAAVDPRRAAVVECRFFGDMDVEETARTLGLSTATVKRDWRLARAWLIQTMDAR